MSQLNHLGVGEVIPKVRFPVREGDAWRDLTTEEIFADKTVVVFALPGAFTPTCSSSHLPGYATYAQEIKAAGVNEIYCRSVNDWIVMDAWRQGLGIKDEVLMRQTVMPTSRPLWGCSSKNAILVSMSARGVTP
jgi:peroxiredoxin